MEGNIKYVPLGIGLATLVGTYLNYGDEAGSLWCYAATSLAAGTILYTELIG